jgi:hypothetical protein
MPHRVKTTYSMLGLNGRALPPPPPPQPEPDTDNSSDDDVDPRFAVWREAFYADAEAKAPPTRRRLRS